MAFPPQVKTADTTQLCNDENKVEPQKLGNKYRFLQDVAHGSHGVAVAPLLVRNACLLLSGLSSGWLSDSLTINALGMNSQLNVVIKVKPYGFTTGSARLG
jgi:hypothetical protein